MRGGRGEKNAKQRTRPEGPWRIHPNYHRNAEVRGIPVLGPIGGQVASVVSLEKLHGGD